MLEKIQEMAPLFKKHAFWDTQPVQKGFEQFNVPVSFPFSPLRALKSVPSKRRKLKMLTPIQLNFQKDSSGPISTFMMKKRLRKSIPC